MWSWHMMQSFSHSVVQLKSTSMRLRGRLRVWVGLATVYLGIMGFVYILNIPLRSKTLHSHYDLSGDAVKLKHHKYVRMEADKIAQEALRKSKVEINEDQQVKILTDTFKRADFNGDSILEVDEMSGWISGKIKEHLTLALRENFFMFTAIDQDPRNGQVSWEEYYRYFLTQHGYDEQFIKEHKTSTKGMSRTTKEAIMRDKAAWSEAARDDADRLTIDEFLSFRHPESSHSSILSIVEEMLSRLDIDEDGLLTMDEFSDPMLNEVPEYLTDEQFKTEHQHEFKSIIDIDKNGKVDRRELLTYMDPRSYHHAEKDAVNLVSAADANRDGMLSLSEVLDNMPLFMASKMIDAGKSFHDEF